MAGALTARHIIKCTGLGESVTIDNDAVTMTVPVEHSGSPLYVIHSDATSSALQLSTLFPQYDVGAIYAVYIKSESGTIYVMLNTSGTATFGATTADIQIKEGEEQFLLINPDLTTANGMTIDAASSSDAFSISVWVKSE